MEMLAPRRGYKEDVEELQNSIRNGISSFELTYADVRCRGGVQDRTFSESGRKMSDISPRLSLIGDNKRPM